jgi:transposase
MNDLHQEKDSQVVAWIGLDWSKDQHDLCLLPIGSSKRESSILEHNPKALREWVQRLRVRFPTGRVALALEQSRGALFHFFMDYDFLLLYSIPPASLAAFRKAFHLSGAKNDPGDARLLLDLLLQFSDHFHPWVPDDPATRSLRLLVQHRRQLINLRTRLTNQLTDLLQGYFPQALAWAGALNTLQACDFLSLWPTLTAAQKASSRRLQNFYQRHGCRKTQIMEQRLQQIAQAQPLTHDPAILQSSPRMVQALVASLRALIPQIKSMDDEIKKLFAAHPDKNLFDVLPGAGAVLAPRLLAAFGSDRSRFQNAQQIQHFSGIAPIIKRSGKSIHIHRRLACPKFLRQSFHEFAACSVHFCGWARVFYEQQRSRGKKHHTAVRALAYKWIRILFRCWQTHTPYNEAIYLQSLQRRNSQLLVAIPVSK